MWPSLKGGGEGQGDPGNNSTLPPAVLGAKPHQPLSFGACEGGGGIAPAPSHAQRGLWATPPPPETQWGTPADARRGQWPGGIPPHVPRGLCPALVVSVAPQKWAIPPPRGIDWGV